MTAIMTSIDLLWRTQLLQRAMNSVAQFVRTMHHVFEELTPHICNQFLDDIRVKGPKTDYEGVKALPGIWWFMLKHIQNIDKVLSDAECTGITVAEGKSQWLVAGVKVVEFVCDHEGCHSDQTKISKITEWLPCKNLKKAWAFISVCMYYHIWIQGFAFIAASIYWLFCEGVPFFWRLMQQDMMDVLKLKLTSALTLASLDYSEEVGMIILAVDANGSGWGAALMQVSKDSKQLRHIIRFESSVWSPQEQMYDAGRRECQDVLLVLKKLQYWLYEIHFVLEIDANTLVAQLNQAATDLPGALMTWWMTWIKLFDFTIHHIPGKRHGAINGLSWQLRQISSNKESQKMDDFIDAQINAVTVTSITVEKLSLEGSETLLLLLRYSENSMQIAHYLNNLQKPALMTLSEFWKFKSNALHFVVQSQHLFRQTSKNILLHQVVDLNDEKLQILRSLHEESTHRGREGTYCQVTNHYWWGGLYQDVKWHVKSCVPCQLRALKKKEKELHSMYVSIAWEKIRVNVMHMSFLHGYNYLVIARDDLSEWMKWRAIISITAETVTKFLWEDIFCRHRTPWKVVMDGGPENKQEVEALLAKLRVKKVMVSAYHPQMNGMIEHEHTPIVQALSKSCENQPYQWRHYMSAVAWADKTTTCESTDMSLYCFLHDENLVLLIELSVPTWGILPWNTVCTRVDLLTLKARQLEHKSSDIEKAALHLWWKRKEHKNLFDKAHQMNSGFHKDDLVLLHDTKLDNCFDQKLASHWLRPYQIHQAIIEKETYLLAELDETHLSGTMPDNWLKHFTIWASTSNEPASVNEDSSLLVEKNQSEPAVEDEVMQNDDYMVLSASPIQVSELRDRSQRSALEVILPSLDSDCWNDFIHNE